MTGGGDLFGYSSAEFSSCRAYRYALWRWWDKSKPYSNFVCLNPSTADEISDDNTVRRCISFSKSWGFGGFCMTNIFAFRATSPKVMKAQEDPIGPDNDKWLLSVCNGSALTVAAWGTHGSFLGRGEQVKELLQHAVCLGVNRDGSPKHPLYLSKKTELRNYV